MHARLLHEVRPGSAAVTVARHLYRFEERTKSDIYHDALPLLTGAKCGAPWGLWCRSRCEVDL